MTYLDEVTNMPPTVIKQGPKASSTTDATTTAVPFLRILRPRISSREFIEISTSKTFILKFSFQIICNIVSESIGPRHELFLLRPWFRPRRRTRIVLYFIFFIFLHPTSVNLDDFHGESSFENLMLF